MALVWNLALLESKTYRELLIMASKVCPPAKGKVGEFLLETWHILYKFSIRILLHFCLRILMAGQSTNRSW